MRPMRARAIFRKPSASSESNQKINLECAASARAFRVDGGASARDRSVASLTRARD